MEITWKNLKQIEYTTGKHPSLFFIDGQVT